ncbi:hypothetical protein C0J52_24151 [Blattella germanica]|nr:hypothetical protein C0J52_24151 [Blattella germanica]
MPMIRPIGQTLLVICLVIGYLSVLTLWWQPQNSRQFALYSYGVWILLACYLANLAQSFQVNLNNLRKKDKWKDFKPSQH